MKKNVYCITFSNVKINSYIYGINAYDSYLFTYKWKVLGKEIKVSRLNGDFGGPKITTIIFTCKLVEYCGNVVNTNYTHILPLNGKETIGYNGTMSYYPIKERFINHLKYLEESYKKTLKQIQVIIKNQIQR